MQKPSRLAAILQAVFVTFLWSTSWVLIKIDLRADLPPITFAGLRYGLATLCLAPFVFRKAAHREMLRSIPSRGWIQLTLLGIVLYTLTQGAQYVSLDYLPAVVVNLLLNLTPISVGVMAFFITREPPTKIQWLGIVLTAVGIGVYFLPFTFPPAAIFGLVVAIVGMLTNAISSLQGRQANRDMSLPPLVITFISMGIGAVLMLVIGIGTQGPGVVTWSDWGIIAWLAIVNTAFAFTLWNNTLRTLTAVESSILNSLMMPQIAILALIFLGETITVKDTVGLVLVFAGVIVVQLKRRTSGKIGQESCQTTS